jgi:hypothetical protein
MRFRCTDWLRTEKRQFEMSDLRDNLLWRRIALPPTTMLVGDASHRDFNDAVELLRAESRLVDCVAQSPELMVVCQSRPGTVRKSLVESLRRAAPLAGIVALAGSWCEGETRTGRPLAGVDRLYWHAFPAWWRRQMSLRVAGHCPDWADASPTQLSEPGRRRPRPTVVAIRTDVLETANSLSDTLNDAGIVTTWQRGSGSAATVRGSSVGIWVGGQLSDSEVADLRAFSRSVASTQSLVIALLDFPRRDSVDRAREAGAAAVFGMPCNNADLIETLEALIEHAPLRRAA